MKISGFILATLLFLASVAIPPAMADKKGYDSAIQRAERIKGNKLYYHGNGYGATRDEAERMALEDLCGKISRTVGIATKSHDTQDSEEFSSKAYISTFVTLNNTESIDISQEEGKFEVLIYVERAQVENDMAMREEKIKTLAKLGRDMEKRLEIASALKYFNWAYALAGAYNKPVMLDIDGMNHEAKAWLDSHINLIFTTLKFELEQVEERPDELDPYLVNLAISFMGQPVADLDYSYYNNGNRVDGQHVKNGRASLMLEKLPQDELDISVNYKYEQEGSQYDSELKTIYLARRPATFRKSDISIPCKGVTPEKFQLKEAKLSKEEKAEIAQNTLMAPTAVAPERKRITPEAVAEETSRTLMDAMQKVKDAIGSRNYASVSGLFTPEGFAIFSRMMNSGKVRVASSASEWRVEMGGGFMVGKSIPVTIKYAGGHSVAEDIVFRFNDENKIESVAYALTKRAEDDIFRQNSWSLPARYAILQFMEDYQTAYALKDAGYIEKIYSDDAVIIHGKKNPNAGKMRKADGSGFFVTAPYTYSLQTKDQFIQNLKKDFNAKKYIKLTFEDNEIREQSGIYQNIFWIEIKQFYSSNTYNDEGYLTLMIDMREADPTIKVRTWAPDKIPLNDLMSKYTVE